MGEIEQRFEFNIARVRGIVALYASMASGSGRRPVSHSDLLRASVMLLHATLEDVFRSIASWRLPEARVDVLDKVPWAGQGRATKATLGTLALHRGRTVDEVIRASVVEWLDTSNYNNVGQLTAQLSDLDLPPTLLDPHRPALGAMMARRHWIVHRADMNVQDGNGHHSTRPLSKATVDLWIEAVEAACRAVLEAVR